MIRVLHIMGCSDAGGISSVVLNYYRYTDRTKIHFDIGLTIPTIGQNGHALQELGAVIHFLPLKSEGLAAYEAAVTALLKKENYDAVHVHDSETSYVTLRIAQKAGVCCRVAHCHTTSPWEGIKGEIRRLSGCVLNYHYATRVIGCGQLAGERVYGKYNMKRPRALVLPNAVETEKFAYQETVRGDVRRELSLEDKFVIGMVGRLTALKNYPFALEILGLLRQTCPEAVLVIAGNGEDEILMRQKIQQLGLQEQVTLLGRRGDVERLYQAYDLFLLPSLSEGFPVAAVEALSSGLPVLLSDRITGELKSFSKVRYLPLGNAALWAEAIAEYRVSGDRTAGCREAVEQGLDIQDGARKLEQIYLADLEQQD